MTYFRYTIAFVIGLSVVGTIHFTSKKRSASSSSPPAAPVARESEAVASLTSIKAPVASGGERVLKDNRSIDNAVSLFPANYKLASQRSDEDEQEQVGEKAAPEQDESPGIPTPFGTFELPSLGSAESENGVEDAEEVRVGIEQLNDLGAAAVAIPGSDEQLRLILGTKVTLDLRDATLLQALSTLREVCGLNFVVGDDVAGTVNASYTDSAVSEVLDTLLLPRGYGYRIISGSVAVMPLASIGDRLDKFKIEVVSLRAVSPDEILSSVESILSPEGKAFPIPSSHSLMMMDYPERISEAMMHIERLDAAAEKFAVPQLGLAGGSTSGSVQAVAASLEVRVFEPQFVRCDVLLTAITPLLTTMGTASALELENKVIVRDVPSAIRDVDTVILQLDRPRPQVRIEALIYDCSLEDAEAIGVNFRGGGNGNGIDAATGNPRNSVVLDAVTSAVAGPTNGVLTLSTLTDNFQLNSILQALREGSDSRLLADPKVVVMNHESAKIAIVTEVPYQQLTQGIQGGAIGTTEFREAGVTLSVTPSIAADGTVAMKINPQFSLLTGFTPVDNAPIIDRRETSTTVRVASGHTLVIGGLRQRTRIVEENKVPLLGDIPWAGRLFRHNSSTAQESELLVFLRPQVVDQCYMGEPREIINGEMLHGEIEQAPTDPIPFGADTIRAEKLARKRAESCLHGLDRESCATCNASQPMQR